MTSSLPSIDIQQLLYIMQYEICGRIKLFNIYERHVRIWKKFVFFALRNIRMFTEIIENNAFYENRNFTRLSGRLLRVTPPVSIIRQISRNKGKHSLCANAARAINLKISYSLIPKWNFCREPRNSRRVLYLIYKIEHDANS